MFQLQRFFDQQLEVYEISDDRGTTARFVPERGGILTEFMVKSQPVFYIEPETLHDVTKNIRGGNPVLFPVCGPLENGRYSTSNGRTFEMKQHGIARNRPWTVTKVECGAEQAEIGLKLESDNFTMEQYPFAFSLEFTYIVEPEGLNIKQKYINRSDNDMPFYAGFHPYFYAPGLKARSLEIPALTCYDVKTGEPKEAFHNLNLNHQPETNLVYGGLQKNEAWFQRQDGHRVTISFDNNFRYVVLWAFADKEFLCLEPWMGDNHDMNKGKAKLLEPGQELISQVRYQVTFA